MLTSSRMAPGSRGKAKPLPKRFQPKEPVPPFVAGAVVRTMFKPVLYNITEPITVLGCQQSKSCMSGWGVAVGTSAGEKVIDSQYFYT